MRAAMAMSRGVRALAALALVATGAARAADDPGPIAVYGNKTTLEIAPVLLAAEKTYAGKATVSMGSVTNLVGAPSMPEAGSSGIADVATNAETQALRYSVQHPEMRIIMTVTEGLYRIVARRSAGIKTLADLKGKRVATIPPTSSGYFVQKMLKTVGLSTADVTFVPVSPLTDMPKALAEGKVDAVSIWEPESENAKRALGADAIEFNGKGIYRELFNLNTTAGNLADPVKRKKIVAFVRAIIDACAEVRRDPTRAQQLVVASSGYSADVIAHSWEGQAFIATLPADLLDVLVEEDAWLAAQDKRPARTRAQLAPLIDASVLAEAQALKPALR